VKCRSRVAGWGLVPFPVQKLIFRPSPLAGPPSCSILIDKGIVGVKCPTPVVSRSLTMIGYRAAGNQPTGDGPDSPDTDAYCRAPLLRHHDAPRA
jgi:hypothetical protein